MPNYRAGHTLIELMIAMAFAAILITAIFQVYQVRQNSHSKQELAIEMQQNIRAAISLIKREVRMAGFDPAASDGEDSDGDLIVDNETESAGTGIRTAGRHMIQIAFDLDGDINVDPSENVTYGFAKKYDADANGIADSGGAPLGRRTGAGPLIGIAENIQAVGFAYAFDHDNDGSVDTDDGTIDGNIIWAYDSNPDSGNRLLTTNLVTGLPLAAPVPLSEIRAVRIWILSRTREPVRGHFERRTYTVGDRTILAADRHQRRLISTTVYCRNMSM
jgi:type IV pilus assembly protein PilW